MNQISSQQALAQIKNMGIAYVMEADSLRYLIEDEETVECWVHEDMLITVNPCRDTTFIVVLPLHNTFDVDALLALVSEQKQKISMLVNVQALSDSFIQTLDQAMESLFIYERTLIDYVHTHSTASVAIDAVRLLEAQDKAAFVSCTQEQIKNRPPLAVLFDIFVNRHQGQILAAFDGERVVGYLSFNAVADDVYDVDYIYVHPDMREQGIGKQLTSAYVQYANAHGFRAYWSNAKNEESEKTALSCGFSVIRQAKKFITKDA